MHDLPANLAAPKIRHAWSIGRRHLPRRQGRVAAQVGVFNVELRDVKRDPTAITARRCLVYVDRIAEGEHASDLLPKRAVTLFQADSFTVQDDPVHVVIFAVISPMP